MSLYTASDTYVYLSQINSCDVTNCQFRVALQYIFLLGSHIHELIDNASQLKVNKIINKETAHNTFCNSTLDLDKYRM